MKRINYYMAALLTFGLGACNEDYNEGIEPQTNPQETEQSYEGLSLKLGTDFADTLDLNTYAVTESLFVVEATETPEMSETATLEYVLEISNTNTFDKTASVEVGDGTELGVDPLNAAYREVFGKSPSAQTVYVRFKAYIAEGTARIQIGEYFTLGSVVVTPIPMDLPDMESAYYIIGNMTGWNETDVTTLIPFEHSDADVYDDPVFTCIVEVTDNCYWKIIPQSCIDAVVANTAESVLGTGVLGSTIDGDTSEEGTLTSNDPQALKFESAGYYSISINVMDETFQITALGSAVPMPETMYIIGSPYNWSWDEAVAMTLVNGVSGQFWAIQYFDADAAIKFNSNKDWDGGEYGYSAASADAIAYANLSDDGGNMKIGTAGWYLVTVTTSYADESQTALSYTVDMQEAVVYLMGETTADGWTAKAAASKFTVEGDEFVSPAFVADAALRMFVDIPSLGDDWWRAEFNIFDGAIVYRGNGGDQEAVNVTTGQKAYLNFKTQAGRIE